MSRLVYKALSHRIERDSSHGGHASLGVVSPGQHALLGDHLHRHSRLKRYASSEQSRLRRGLQ